VDEELRADSGSMVAMMAEVEAARVAIVVRGVTRVLIVDRIVQLRAASEPMPDTDSL
jgi:hypothetical protein